MAERSHVEVHCGEDTCVTVYRIIPDGVPGTRPTVVLVHGLGVSGFYFEPLAEALAEHCPVIVFDLPGAGRTAESDGVLTIDALAEVVRGIIRGLQLEDVVLVGHSMGSQVVVETLAQEPTIARAAALLAPVVPAKYRNLRGLLRKFGRTAVHEPFGAVWRSCVGYAQMSPRWLWHQTQAMLRYPIDERISQVRCPLLLVRATHDYVAPRWFLSLLQRESGASRTVVREMPNAAHHMMATHADALTADILRIAGVHDARAEAEGRANLAEEA